MILYTVSPAYLEGRQYMWSAPSKEPLPALAKLCSIRLCYILYSVPYLCQGDS